jgi:hypothetical protein
MSERHIPLGERFRYPSSQDAKDVLRFVPHSLILLAASTVRPFSSNKGDVISELGDHSKSVDEALNKLKLISVPGIIGSIALFIALTCQETQNRIRFGEHLTVSKVALHQKSKSLELFPELAEEKYIGEIHFKGKWKLRRNKDENPRTVMRKLYSDLYSLALAAESNDPGLEDFDYFYGLSSMVTPRLQRFGFKVVHYKDQLGLPALGQDKQRKLSLEMRPVMGAIISKADLIANKDNFYNASNR